MSWIALTLSLLAPATPPAPATPQETATVVVVTGAGGTPEYGREFAKWADRWADAARRGGATLVQVGRAEPGAGDTPKNDATGGADGETDKDRLRAILARETAAAAGADLARPLWLVLIGHGTFDGREAKFNLRGPDVTDEELAAWLRPCRRPLAVIDCSSASAPFLNRLSGPGRVVITATRGGSEGEYARFGEYLSAAVADPAADLDKDGETSLLEAFLAASHNVNEFYKSAARIATEHALLDDNGDRLGVSADWFEGVRAKRAAKDGAAPDGAAAHRWRLLLSPADLAMTPEQRARRDRLEVEIESLRARKATLAEAAYYAQLEPLLLRLARLYEEDPPSPAPGPKPAAATDLKP